MNYVNAHPKATITAFSGIALWALNKFVFDFPPEVDIWIEMLLLFAASLIFGYFNRLTKAEATVLQFPEVKAEIKREEKKELS